MSDGEGAPTNAPVGRSSVCSEASSAISIDGVTANGRFGVRRTTEVMLCTNEMQYTSRSYSRDEFEYVSLDSMDPLSLHVKFRSRPRPKQFFFKSREACEEALQRISDWGGAHHSSPTSLENTPSFAEASVSFAHDMRDLGDPDLAAAQHDLEHPGSSLMQCWQGNARSCRTHPVEATMFGVLLPIAIMCAMLVHVVTELRAHGGPWLAAGCHLHARFIVAERLYHSGRYAHGESGAFESGYYFQLQPAYNCTVVVKHQHHNASERWPAVMREAVLEEESPTCDGAIGASLAEAEAACDGAESWLPALPVHEAVGCFYRLFGDRENVYRTIKEPPAFYLQFAVMAACLATAAVVGVCLLRVWCCGAEQRKAAWLHMGISRGALLGHLQMKADVEPTPRGPPRERRVSWDTGPGAQPEML